jgi:hypothetical protein
MLQQAERFQNDVKKYNEAIENMPIIQAFPDDTEIMKYKLITLPRGTAALPVINV